MPRNLLRTSYTLRSEPNTNSRRLRAYAYGEDALFIIVVILNKIFIRACRAMNEEQPSEIQEMHKMISDLAVAPKP